MLCMHEFIHCEFDKWQAVDSECGVGLAGARDAVAVLVPLLPLPSHTQWPWELERTLDPGMLPELTRQANRV